MIGPDNPLFKFFSKSSPSVVPVTQDYFYNMNATEHHAIVVFKTTLWRLSGNIIRHFFIISSNPDNLTGQV